MTAALTCYILLPTGLALRPPMVQGDGLCAQLVRWLYTTDTPTNVCPSIHVFNSVTLALAYRRSQIFAGANRRWLRAASYGLCIAICASTMLLKQHSCIDVAFGLALAFAMDSAARALWRRKAWEERLA